MTAMSFLRRISTRKLLTLCAAVAGVVIGVTAAAIATTQGGPRPNPEPLPVAVRGALTAPKIQGVSARIQLTNHLISGSDVQGADPVLSGASGRLWASSDGRLRIELQADSNSEGATSDSEVLVDGRQASAYDSGSNTLYRATLPASHHAEKAKRDRPPSLAEIKKGIARLTDHARLSGAEPSDVAGRPAYAVRIEPKRHGGLVGGAALAWDAVRGTPLRAAVYARGDDSPVLELKVTDISYGPVPSDVFDIGRPRGAKIVDLGGPKGGANGRGKGQAPVTGVRAVEQRTSFPVTAPQTLAGRSENEVRLIPGGKEPGALVTYGRGLDGIAVIEQPADSTGRAPGPSGGEHGQLTLPTVSIDGVRADELETALGTAVRFQRHGVDYTVLGSVPPATAEAAARGL